MDRLPPEPLAKPGLVNMHPPNIYLKPGQAKRSIFNLDKYTTCRDLCVIFQQHISYFMKRTDVDIRNCTMSRCSRVKNLIADSFSEQSATRG